MCYSFIIDRIFAVAIPTRDFQFARFMWISLLE